MNKRIGFFGLFLAFLLVGLVAAQSAHQSSTAAYLGVLANGRPFSLVRGELIKAGARVLDQQKRLVLFSVSEDTDVTKLAGCLPFFKVFYIREILPQTEVSLKKIFGKNRVIERFKTTVEKESGEEQGGLLQNREQTEGQQEASTNVEQINRLIAQKAPSQTPLPPAVVEDAYEPNNTFAMAWPLALGTYNNLGYNDEDWFKVNVASGKYLVVTLTTSGDIDFEISDANHNWVPVTYTWASGSEKAVYGPVTAGYYFIDVYGYGSPSLYNLKLEALNASSVARINGHVTNALSKSIYDVEVSLVDLSYNGITYVYTDGNGDYTIPLVSAGSYKLNFYPSYDSGNYIGEWYNNKSDFSSANTITTTLGTTQTANAQLATGAIISGRVTNASGSGISSVYAEAYDSSNNYVNEGYTDGNGYYTIQGIPPGTAKVYFYAYYATNYISEYYNNKNTLALADSVTVTSGATTTVNAQLAAGGFIRGRVANASGVGIQSVGVSVYDLNHVQIPGTGTVNTDSSGVFSFRGIPAGNVKVYFHSPSASYNSEWYDSKATFETADQIPITVGQTTIVNAQLVPTTSLPIIGLSKSSFNFAAVLKGKTTPADSVLILNLGMGTLAWTAASSATWLVPSPKTGAAGKTMMIKIVNASTLAVGTYTGTITVSDPNAYNSPVTIIVRLVVKAAGTDAVPLGAFQTPADGATVNTATAVISGWAVDDVGMKSAKIYRRVNGAKNALVGTAKFIAGARPDIEASYPTYPQNNRAGWSFTLTMNKLPNKGIGTFMLSADVTDLAGHEVLLGTHTITGVAPAGSAAVPFGTLDTPLDGGTASGSAYHVSGWALTPPPNAIAVGGSALTLWVDGVAAGHPSYGAFREDVAAEYVGHANADRAAGSFLLDTTKYADGWHTIAWSATDSGGSTGEIGGRYFLIKNRPGLNEADTVVEDASPVVGNAPLAVRPVSEIASFPEDGMTPVFAKLGFTDDQAAEPVYPEADGSIRIQIPQVSRLALYLSQDQSFEKEAERLARTGRILDAAKNPSPSSRYQAYALVGEELRQLPIGASFDSRDGILFWQPGPGFLGEHQFVLVDSVSGTRKTVRVTIK